MDVRDIPTEVLIKILKTAPDAKTPKAQMVHDYFAIHELKEGHYKVLRSDVYSDFKKWALSRGYQPENLPTKLGFGMVIQQYKMCPKTKSGPRRYYLLNRTIAREKEETTIEVKKES